MDKTLYVNPNNFDNKTSFKTVQSAINSISKNSEDCTKIHIFPGKYFEKIELVHSNVILTGMDENPGNTEIFFSDGAADIMDDGTRRGTFRSYTFFACGDNIEIHNITISNTSGEPQKAGQAIALYAEGNNMIVKNCRLLGRQDTLFTGPLPPKEIQPGGFIGPRQFSPRINGVQHYIDCYISGDVDFIFGSATAYFENCDIVSVLHDKSKTDSGLTQGYVTAASTPEGQDIGYVFRNCRLLSKDLLPETVYLGRPWRDFAAVTFIGCEIGNHIKSEGFHDWNKENARKNVRFVIENCHRPDGSCFTASADFVKNN